MKRYFCDRCGVEGSVTSLIRIGIASTGTFVPYLKELELCSPCFKLFDKSVTFFLEENGLDTA